MNLYILKELTIRYYMFLLDKYRPRTKDDVYFHKELINQLDIMSKDTMIPNLIFYGPDGSGKSTIIELFLEMIYDTDVHCLNEVTYKVTGSGNITTDIKIKQSNYHIIIEPNNNNFDRYLVQEIVKEYAKKPPFNIFKKNINFKTVLINDVHKLSYYAQTSLRRTMEKYAKNCRFILCSNSLSKVLEPIRSRCISLNINRPDFDSIIKYVTLISGKENIKVTLKEIIKIIDLSNGNIKDIMWLLQLKKEKNDIIISYNKAIIEITNLLLRKNADELDVIINLIYDIITTNIHCSRLIVDIMKTLISSKKLKESEKYKIIYESAKYESRLIKGRHVIIHLQSYICSIMCILTE